MSNIKLYAFSLVCCSAACALIDAIAPSNAKKQLSYIIGLFVLLCMLSPLADLIGYDFGELSVENYTQAQTVDSKETIKKQFEQRLLKIINDKTQTLGILPHEIRIDINISGDCIEISNITVYLSDNDMSKAQNVKNTLSEYLGKEVVIKTAKE